MKNVKFLFTALFALVCFGVSAQDLSGEKYAMWGETVEQRRENMLASQFLKQNLDNGSYDAASGYLKKLLDNCPKGSSNIYARGILLFKRKAVLAKNDKAQRDIYIDSMLMLYDMRAEHFGNVSTMDRAKILDNKARDFLNFRSEDREGLRKVFEDAINAGIEMHGKADPETITIYFSNLCDDYLNGEGNVTPDDILMVYDNLSPQFEGADEATIKQKDMFDNYFSNSGVASCENLESIFTKKLADNPNDEATLAKAVSMMSRTKCTGDFFFATAEQYYKVKPSAETAMFLAQAFQNEQNFEKAIYYLSEALAVETDPVEQEKLYVRIAVVQMAAKNYVAAAQAARSAQGLNPENGYSYFVLAQCYVATASCEGLEGSAVYWAAYDAMSKAIARLESEPETLEHAKSMLSNYRQYFPTAETCFFAELKEGEQYKVNCGVATGVSTTVRFK